MEGRGQDVEPLDRTDRDLLAHLRVGVGGSGAALRLGLSLVEVAARLSALRERPGVTSTRRLLDLLPPEEPGGPRDPDVA